MVLIVTVYLERLIYSKQGIRVLPPIYFIHKIFTDTWRNQIYFCKKYLRLASKIKRTVMHFVCIERQHQWLLSYAFCSLSDCLRDLESDDQILWRCLGSQNTHLKMVGHRLLRTTDPSLLKPNPISSKPQTVRTVYIIPRITQK